MLVTLYYLTALISTRWHRLRDRHPHDTGVTTLEVAIIAAALALLATGLVAIIKAAVTAHEANIK
jgi:hypothetical protein